LVSVSRSSRLTVDGTPVIVFHLIVPVPTSEINPDLAVSLSPFLQLGIRSGDLAEAKRVKAR